MLNESCMAIKLAQGSPVTYGIPKQVYIFFQQYLVGNKGGERQVRCQNPSELWPTIKNSPPVDPRTRTFALFCGRRQLGTRGLNPVGDAPACGAESRPHFIKRAPVWWPKIKRICNTSCGFSQWKVSFYRRTGPRRNYSVAVTLVGPTNDMLPCGKLPQFSCVRKPQ